MRSSWSRFSLINSFREKRATGGEREKGVKSGGGRERDAQGGWRRTQAQGAYHEACNCHIAPPICVTFRKIISEFPCSRVGL